MQKMEEEDQNEDKMMDDQMSSSEDNTQNPSEVSKKNKYRKDKRKYFHSSLQKGI